MSSSCHKSAVLRFAIRLCTASLATAASIGVAHAADTYVQPQLDLRYEANDNLGLDPVEDSDSDAQGYIADFQALIGVATPRSDTSFRPRVRYQDYVDRDFENFEAFLDLKSDYRWERARLRTFGRYSREDSYNADTQGGEFDPDDPDVPTDPGSDEHQIGEIRTRFQIAPEVSFEVSERTALGAAFEYQAVRFDSAGVETRDDYNYVGGSGFVSWALDPISKLRFGAYANRYEITDGSTETDATGGLVEYERRWTENSGIRAGVFYERDEQTDFFPLPGEETSSNWGGTILGFWEGEVSKWRYSIGRSIVGTGGRSKSELDQLKLQYERNLTERLLFTGAGRLESRNSIASVEQANDRDFARADLTLRWMLSRTWYVEGGYSYLWEDREIEEGDASNNKLFISFGYIGLDRRRR